MTEEEDPTATAEASATSAVDVGEDPEPVYSQASTTLPDETVRRAFPELPVRTFDESHIWDSSSNYTPVVALPAHTPIEVGVAGLVAHQTGPVSISPEIRIQDVLRGALVDRNEIRDDGSYVDATEWQQAWREAVNALSEKGIVIVVAPRGYGSTTFSLRLLACYAPENAQLIQLEAEWNSPRVDKLPLRRDRAYQVDLQDPDHDRFDGAFLKGLGKQSTDLKEMGSCLVLAVAEELWLGHRQSVPSAVSVIRLDDPPNAQRLVERHLTAKGFAHLVPYVQQPEAVKHILGRNTVQALRAVDVVVGQWQEYRHRRNVETGTFRPETTFSEPPNDASEIDSSLSHAIVQALGDWRDDLDNLFDEPRRGESSGQPLPPQDRCLLMSLAMYQSGTAAEIESAAFALERSLGKSQLAKNNEPIDAWSAFARRGLRPRLRGFNAEIDTRDRVTFSRPGYAEAVLAYVWENYSGLRDDLITWMVGCAPADGQSADPATATLTTLILRMQDAERLTMVRDTAISHGRPHTITRVMAAAATDEHIGRRARNFLYDWATQRPDIQCVVIAVCLELIGIKEEAALVRLGRVARHATNADVRTRVLAAFRDLAADQRTTARFATTVAAWQKARPASLDVKLGLLSLLGTEADGIPLLPSRSTAIDMVGGLRGLLADPILYPEVVPALVGWLGSCAQDEDLCVKARGLMSEAARGNQPFVAGLEVMKQLVDVRTPSGTSVGQDLYAELVNPELRVLNPLTLAEA
jgi:hypothetical protein